MQQFISNGEGGLPIRNSLNQNFTELYAALYLPIKQPGISGNLNQPIVANTFVTFINLFPVSGSPTVRIGTSPNGTEIMSDQIIDNTYPNYPIQAQQYFASASTLYFTFSGNSGVINIRIDVINNYN